MSKRILALGTSVLFLALASTASAAAAPPDAGPKPGKNAFSKVDRNGDGVIDQQEFAAALKFLKKQGLRHQKGERGRKARGPEGRRGMRGMGQGRGPQDGQVCPRGPRDQQGPGREGKAERRQQRKHRRQAFRPGQGMGMGPACDGSGQMKRGPGERGHKGQGPKGRKAGPRGQKQLERQIEARVQKMLKQRLPKMIRRMVREALNEQGPMHGQPGMRGQHGHKGPMMQGKGRGMERPFRQQRQMHRGDWGRRGHGEGEIRRGEGRRHRGEGFRQGRQNRFGQREGRRSRGEGRRPFDRNRGWHNGPEQLPGCPFGGPMMDDDAGPDGHGPDDFGPDVIDEPDVPAEELDEI